MSTSYLKNSKKAPFIIALAASVCALIFAYSAEYIFNMTPCIMCLYQRKPYFVIIFLSLLALLYKKHLKLLLIICIIMFFIDSGTAFYHVGIEQGVFAPTQGCVSAEMPKTLEELRKAIIGKQLARCDEVQFSIFGLSMAALNGIYAFLVGLLLLALLSSKTPKDKQL